MMILFNIAITLLLIQGIVATSSGGGGGTTFGYQPTSGVEEQWVAEEEFHGAQQHQPKQHKKKKKKVKESSSYPGHEHINEQSWWDEDDTDERLSMQEQSATLKPSTATTKEEKKKTHRKTHRIRIWKDKSTTKSSVVGDDNSVISQTDKKTNEDTDTSTESTTSSSSEYDEEHPMRTDEWQLNIQLSRLYSNKYDINELFPECYSITDRSTSPKDQNVPDVSKRKSSSGYYRKRQVMQFARNGYVKILLDDNSTDGKVTTLKKKPRVGKWRIGHSGVAFDIPVQVSPRRKTKGSREQPRLTTLHYHADIHLNKFGERPRMFRGVITRDRYASSFLPPNFLRPVIGTFSAEGIGHDTSDTSYKERAISLSRQQVINEAKM